MKPGRIFLIFFTIWLSCFSAGASIAADEATAPQKTYVFHTALASPIKEILDSRIQEAFSRMGLEAKISLTPSSQRALILANEDGDGDAARVPNIKELDPQNTTNLIQIPTPILTMELDVYAKNVSFPVDGWSALAAYHNGARVGAKILETNIPGQRTFLPSTAQLVQMLDSGRIDTMVEWNLIAENAINNLKIKGIKKLSPPLKVQPFHLFLHKKHEMLVPKLQKVLSQMQEEGFFSRAKDEIVFYTGAQAPIKDLLEQRLREAYKRAGVPKFKVLYTGSAQRALMLANEEGDGDLGRVPDIKQFAPKETSNLLEIPEPINRIQFYVYTNGAVSSVDGYQSLAPFRNGFRLGAKILEKNVPGEKIMLPDTERLFQMLAAGRIDSVIEWAPISDSIIKEHNYSGITRLNPPLVDMPLYSLIHKKHEEMIPDLVKALKEMKTDGTFDTIAQKVFGKAKSH